jgi:glycerophosphoryl diester phosphodiesterase
MVDAAAKPILVCHRGASALAPENTLESFRVAMQYGMDFSELDVFVSRAGDLVVTHDPVEDDDALPRLSDVFDLVRGRMGIYVELKGEGTALALGDLVRSGVAEDVRLISGSEHLDLVRELQRHVPDVRRSILFRPGWELDGMIAACREVEAAYAHPCFRPVDAALVHGFHAADLLVMTPHTNDAVEAREFVNSRVDVIASDDPRILAPLRAC